MLPVFNSSKSALRELRIVTESEFPAVTNLRDDTVCEPADTAINCHDAGPVEPKVTDSDVGLVGIIPTVGEISVGVDVVIEALTSTLMTPVGTTLLIVRDFRDCFIFKVGIVVDVEPNKRSIRWL